jgi:predicted SAM-dependent methyltransferase
MTSLPQSLHYGCGEVKMPGFLNVDVRATSAADMVCDLGELSKQYKGYFQVIYACHVVEHYPLNKVVDALKMFRALLKPGGLMYISVPNFNILVALYLSRRVELSTIVRAIHGGQEYKENIHYVSFDERLLTEACSCAGFTHAEHFSPDEFLPAGVLDTSTYEIAGKRISLNMRFR